MSALWMGVVPQCSRLTTLPLIALLYTVHLFYISAGFLTMHWASRCLCSSHAQQLTINQAVTLIPQEMAFRTIPFEKRAISTVHLAVKWVDPLWFFHNVWPHQDTSPSMQLFILRLIKHWQLSLCMYVQNDKHWNFKQTTQRNARCVLNYQYL